VTTSLGGFVVLIEDFLLSIYIYISIIISLFIWVGFLVDVSGGVGHVPSHPVLGCDKWYQS